MKTFKIALASLAALAGAAGPVAASELHAYRGQSIDLGSATGVAYFTLEEDGYRVVATIADEDSKAIRFEAVLAPGQSLVLSAPAPVGQTPVSIRVSREGNSVQLVKLPLTN